MVLLEVETHDGVRAKKRFIGVDKQGNRWRARARNPLLRADIHLGYYKTLEEAALVAEKKRAEYEEMFKGMDCSSTGNCRGYFQGNKLPKGVRWNNGRYLAQVGHPKLKKEVFCGSFKNCEEAANAAEKKRAEFEETYGVKLRVIPENQGLQESDSEVKVPPRNLNNDALDDNSNCDCGVVYRPPTSVFEPNDMNSACVSDKTFDLELDRAVSSGIINEYGQLVGKYSEIDAQMWLSATDESVTGFSETLFI